MISIVLAGVSALVWGVADFSGGKASQRARPLAVTVVSQMISLPVLVVCVLAVPGTPRGADLAWGAAAGACGLFGIVLLYRALSSGAMAVVAPTTAATAAIIPMIVGLADGPPGGFALLGAACAVVAIVLVSLGPSAGRGAAGPRLIGIALAAGALFGVFFSLLGQASDEAGVWPVVAVRLSVLPLGLLLMISTGTPWRLPGRVLPWVVAAGVLDVSANVTYVVAVTHGHLSVVAPIAALYPASTVLLAHMIDRERIRPIQVAGLALAAAALVLAST